jgi:DNA-binding Lrp family transcriptional regulator
VSGRVNKRNYIPSKRRSYNNNKDGTILDSININIIKELVSEPESRSATIATKYNIPLSTIQRRRARLEDSILKKKYHIDIKEIGWRKANLLIAVEKGKGEEVAKKILKNTSNIINTSLRIGDPAVNVAADIFYKNSQELHKIIENVRSMPYVKDAEWYEIVKEIGNNNTEILNVLLQNYYEKKN